MLMGENVTGRKYDATPFSALAWRQRQRLYFAFSASKALQSQPKLFKNANVKSETIE